MSEYSCTAFMWQRIHQVPRYFLILLDYLVSNPQDRFVVWSSAWSTLGISEVLILLNKVAHFHHISHIRYPFPKQVKMPLNIFNDGSRLSLPSLLPQSVASKTNVILVTVPQRRILLMLCMKIIQPFFCLIFPCSYPQGSHLLLYLQHHTEFAFSGLCTIPPQSLTPLLFGRRHLPFVYIWCAFFLAGHMTLPLTLLFNKPFLSKKQSQAAQLTHYQAGIAILPTLWLWPLFTIRDYIFSFTSLIKILKSTGQKENLTASL